MESFKNVGAFDGQYPRALAREIVHGGVEVNGQLVAFSDSQGYCPTCETPFNESTPFDSETETMLCSCGTRSSVKDW